MKKTVWYEGEEWILVSTPISRKLEVIKKFIKNLFAKKDIWSF